jgi:hypothetical protein
MKKSNLVILCFISCDVFAYADYSEDCTVDYSSWEYSSIGRIKNPVTGEIVHNPDLGSTYEPEKWHCSKAQENLNKKKLQEENESKQYAEELAKRVPVVDKNCKGHPRAYLQVIEKIATKIRVHPDSIELKRVEYLTYPLIGSNCVATFYSPNGVYDCIAQFSNDGIINSCE